MEIRDLVLEIRTSKILFKEYQEYFRSNPKEYKNLIELIIEEEAYPIPEYASWILSHLCKIDASVVQLFYNTIVDKLFITKNQSVKRNLINVLDHLELGYYRESELIDLLLSFLNDFENKVAVQVYSIQVLTKFVAKYPELKSEVAEVVELNSENKSPAYSASSRKFYKKTNYI